MKKIKNLALVFIIVVFSFNILPSIALLAKEEIPVALVTGIRKGLEVTRKGSKIKATVGMDLFEGDVLKTGKGCQAVIMMGDGSELTLNQSTEITIKEYNNKKKNIFIKMGEIFGKFAPQETKMIFETPQGVAGIEGTEFNLKVDDKESEVTVSEGSVAVGEDEKNLNTKIKDNQQGRFNKGNVKKPDNVGPKEIPSWNREMNEYGATLGRLLEKLSESVNESGKPKPKSLLELSESDLQKKIKGVERFRHELEGIESPEEGEKFQKTLEKITDLLLEQLNDALYVVKHPKDRAAKKNFHRKRIEFLKKGKEFFKELKPQQDSWQSKVGEFKENYRRGMQSR